MFKLRFEIISHHPYDLFGHHVSIFFISKLIIYTAATFVGP